MTGDSDNDRTDWREPLELEGPAAAVPATSHIVVGFDRHATSHAALRCAIDMAARMNAHLHVAHIVDVDDLPVDPDAPNWERGVAECLERERADATALLRTHSPGNWTYHCRRGDPAKLLRALADTLDAAMIVIGAPRHDMLSRFERALGESVSGRLLHHAHRPVLLVPENTRPIGGTA